MKRYLYLAFMVAGAVALCGCKETEGTDPGSGGPAVTFYSYDVPEGYDADNTVAYRLCPGDGVETMWVFTESQEDKEAYVAANGEEAYAARVVEKGTEYAGEDTEIVITDLEGLFVTTAVAEDASGNRAMFENVFKGVIWVEAGRGYVFQNFVHDGANYISGYVNVERQSDANIFRVGDLFCQLDPTLARIPSYVTFTFDSEHAITDFDSSEAPFVIVNFPDGEQLLHGYYETVQYGDYCYVEQGSDDNGNFAHVSLFVLDNNTGKLYTGGYIDIYTDYFEWAE